MKNKYIYKKSKEDWYDPEYPNDIVAPCYWYDWTLYKLETYDLTDRGGEIEEGFEFVDSVSEGEQNPFSDQDKKYCNFYFDECVDADFNMGDKGYYLALDKVHWDIDGLDHKETAWISDDWEFEFETSQFIIPKRFIKALEHWKKFKENRQ